jgi:uncharacterized RDD family membrane protein YckC
MKFAGAFRRTAGYVIDDLFLSIPELIFTSISFTSIAIRLPLILEDLEENASLVQGYELLFEVYLPFLLPAIAISFTLGVLYYIVLPFYYDGKTIGRQIVGIKVISANHEKLGLLQIAIREISKSLFWLLTFGVGILVDWYLVVATPKKQSVCDRIANTLVIELEGESVGEADKAY